MDERLLLADRTHRFSAPLALFYVALTTDIDWWLGLQPGEVAPRVLEAQPEARVVWSSLWPVSPLDTIEFDLSRNEKTAVRFRWYSSSPPDERGIAITRQRLNVKFGSHLRSVDTDWFWSGRYRGDGRGG